MKGWPFRSRYEQRRERAMHRWASLTVARPPRSKLLDDRQVINRFDQPALAKAVRKKRLGRKDRQADVPLVFRANHLGRLLRLETLEDRSLLSASSDIVPLVSTPGDVTPYQLISPTDAHFSPQWLEAAYSDNNIYFGTAVGNGAGQTIAIVDAYNDPVIEGDMTQFDAQFGFPAPPSFTVVNQTGGTTNLPITDPIGAGPGSGNWTTEESLDVEWAHAMAPAANIVLVEANSNSRSDLYTAIAEAAKLGSVVSTSWGSTEFSGELSYDSYFTAPGVTFVAGAGDDGSAGGHYPADSPNVLSIGGTSLTASSNNGAPPYAYVSETAWSNSGGGTSIYEPEPTYQDGVQSTGNRTIPDVASDANPTTGVWVYDSFNNTNGGGDWYGVGGNSLGGPTWAGLIAIADQGRVAAGLPTLSGAAQTLPALYSLEANSPGDFHDITTGGNGTFNAGPGYDEVTGLGSPVANLLLPGLIGDGTVGAATELTITTQPPASVATGSTFGLTVVAEDASGTIDPTYNGPVTISLADNPGGGTLGGTLSATAVDGVATFTNLTVSQADNGYTLEAIANGLSSTTTSSFNVLAAPTVTPSSTTGTFRIGGAAMAVDSGLMVSSSDADLSGATVTIAPGTLQTGDTLNFTSQNGINGSYSAGVLTLSGNATPAQYQTALQSVTFSTSSTTTSTRSLSIVAADGAPDDLDSSPASESINVAVAAPVVTPSGAPATFSINGAAVAVDAGVLVRSSDADLSGATVSISLSTLEIGDTLNFINQSGISGSYSGGVLTLTGSATVAQYQAALQSVTFSTTSPFVGLRSLTVVAIDGAAIYGPLNSIPAAESVNVAADSTLITPSGVTNTFTLGGSAVAVDPGVTLSSSDPDLTGTTVTITNYVPGDALNFTNQSGISGSYSAGVLTLSGSATPAQYQTALRSVTFSTTNNNTTTRSLSIVAINGALESNPATESVKVITTPAVVTPSGAMNTFTLGGPSVAVDAGVTVSYYGADLSGATVTISAGTLQPGDTLHFTNQNGISGSYLEGLLTLSGSATPAEYQAALQSVTFSTTGTFTNTRSLSIVAISGSQDSNAAVESVNVMIAPPVVTPSGTVSTFTLGGTSVPVDAGLAVQSFDPALTEATVTITNYQPGDTLHFHSQDGLVFVSNAGGVLTLSNFGHASATPAEYQAALQTVTFSTTSTVTTTRSLSIVVDDSLASPTASNTAAESINVAFPAPVVTPSGSVSSYTAGASPCRSTRA